MPTRALVKIFGSGLAYQLVVGLLLLEVSSWWTIVMADCWYDNLRHREGSEVPTGEPCLNCTCTRNVLLCYLRVCPKLPNPPPPGCILLHRYNTCCPELICSDFYDGGNSLESRSDPHDSLELFPDENLSYKHGCILEGSIYAPGSAMHSGSLCEYCYCLAGKQVCVKPKCLMNMEGCTPEFEDTSCCPIRYNCTRTNSNKVTTTSTISSAGDKGGCMVDGSYYNEGSKVVGVGHSVCDNCYCMQGILRCEPLSCAPPLLGCTPVVRPGECCAASYNCNGTLEINAEPNYGLFPIISKEYSKFRKEVHTKSPPIENRNGVVTVAPLYVLSDSWLDPTTKIVYQRSSGTTRHFSSFSSFSSTPEPLKERSTGTKIRSEAKPENIINKSTVIKKNKHTTPTIAETKEDSLDYLDLNKFNILSIVDTLLDTTVYEKENDKNVQSSDNTESNITSINSTLLDENEISNSVKSDILFENSTVVLNDIETTETTTTDYSNEQTTPMSTEISFLESTTTEEFQETTTFTETTTDSELITLRSVIKSTDCIDNIEHTIGSDILGLETTTLISVDPNEVNKLSDVEIDTSPLTTTTQLNEYFIETTSNDEKILETIDIDFKNALITNNITSSEEHPDYDYIEPTLPNVKIIPFVAADALDLKEETPQEHGSIFDSDKANTNTMNYNTNLFSPPTKTEGGFIPKEPPILQSFYNNVFPTRNNIPQNVNVDCISNNQEIPHGVSVVSDSSCMTCTCFYGNVVCQKPNCPPPRHGCKQAARKGVNLCCPNYVCDDSIVLDRYDIIPELVTVAEGIIPTDPFKDVIKTEPAPDLQSLMGDMILLQKGSTPLPPTSTPEEGDHSTTLAGEVAVTEEKEDHFFELDKIWKLIFSKEESTTKSERPHLDKISDTSNLSDIFDPYSNKHVNISANLPNVSYASVNINQYSVNKTETISNNNSDKITENLNKTNSHKFITSHDSSNKTVNNTIGVGMLKLAGCNIYGRMYRVGRIISELSGPCLECKCTEIGVQCRQLNC